MLIQAAINGGRAKAEHAPVPVTPEEQAAAVVECLSAGAGAVHLHVRSSFGVESLDPDDVARTLRVVKSAAPLSSIGISTGAWIVPDPAERIRLATAWKVLPDFASVNFSEEGAVELVELLLSKGVGVEAGLCDAGNAEIFVESGLAPRCLRVLLEPQEQEIEKTRETVNRMRTVLDENGVSHERVLHGTEATTWPMLKEAINLGYGLRIGFEDTLQLTDGTLAESNGELVADALKLIYSARTL
ncbi:MAG TPA: 3-keto-5-aminohexanoate cleavage protein [Pyrinomonadaceae bacterium]|nr:3-keto-5-aminohexanoate cleavage protein [Pyrinomonadaceae bacterium]